MKRIYLIDCPGVVPPSNNDSPEDILLRGVVRVENVENPEQYITAVLKKTKRQHIERTYDVNGFSSATEFLELLARKGGRLLKGGEADVDGAAKMVLNDFLRGKIPWFTPPPVIEGEEKGIDGRKGALGEMGRKNKLEDGDSAVQDADMVMKATNNVEIERGNELEDEDAFEGFGEEMEEDEDEDEDQDGDDSLDSSDEDEREDKDDSMESSDDAHLEADVKPALNGDGVALEAPG